MGRKLTLEEAKDKIYNVFGDLYDMSLFTEYNGNKKRFPLICQKHGVFWAHLNAIISSKCGCPYCAGKNKTTEMFIEEAQEIHGQQYDYTNIIYKGAKIPIEIKCNVCGTIFQQTPNDHLSGYGCKTCGYKKARNKLLLTTEEFKKKASVIHYNKYDYSLVHCDGNDKIIDIICPIHGVFKQKQKNHLQGRGCPECNKSKMEMEIKDLLENHNIKFIQQATSKHLRWLGLQSLDFFLPAYNVAIECQGGQHFKSVEFWGGDSGLELRERLDKMKLEKCKKNNVKLLYYSNLGIGYPYEVFENKEEMLNEIIKSNKVEN